MFLLFKMNVSVSIVWFRPFFGGELITSIVYLGHFDFHCLTLTASRRADLLVIWLLLFISDSFFGRKRRRGCFIGDQ